MKKYIYATIAALIIFMSNVYSQEAVCPIEVLCYGGPILIIDFGDVQSAQQVNGSTMGIFFGENDPRNSVTTLSFQGANYKFPFLLTPLSLSCDVDGQIMIVIEDQVCMFQGGQPCPDCEPLVDLCPERYVCDNDGIFLEFLDHMVAQYHASSDISVLAPDNISMNGTYTPSTFTYPLNDILLLTDPDLADGCASASSLTFTLSEGITCDFINEGVAENCPPWGGVLGAGASEYCVDFYDHCYVGLLDFLTNSENAIACKQWEDPCSMVQHIHRSGNVSINTTTNESALTVKDGIITDDVMVQFCSAGQWCDYVFDPDYDLMPLEEVKSFIDTHGHLPKTPSAKEVEAAGGFKLKATSLNQQEKIEELFLHLIDLKKRADALAKEYEYLKLENERLKKRESKS